MRYVFALIIVALMNLFGAVALAAELVAVAPPTDWTGVAIVSVLGLIFVAVAAYIVHIKRTPGMQFGEEEIERLAAAIDRRRGAVPPQPVPSAPPLTFDGITFATDDALDDYKDAKALVDSYKKEPKQ